MADRYVNLNQSYVDSSSLFYERFWTGDLPASTSTVGIVNSTRAWYDATPSGNQFTIYAISRSDRILIGWNTPAYGSLLGYNVNAQFKDYSSSGPGGGVSEYGGLFAVVNCYHTKTNHDAHYWFTDWSQHGPNSGQERFMGASFFSAKYHPTETIDANHGGFYGWVITSVPGSGGGGDEGKAGLTTYRGRAAFAVTGWAGPVGVATSGASPTATDCWQYCFAAGLKGGPWTDPTVASKYSEAFYAQDYTVYGLHLAPRNSVAATGQAVYVEQGAGSIGIYTTPIDGVPMQIFQRSGIDSAALVFKTDASGAAPSPRVKYQRQKSPSANDLLGVIEFDGWNNAHTDVGYGQINGVIHDPTTGSESGGMEMRVMNVGVSGIGLRVSEVGLDLGNIPTANPHVVGRVWANSGVLTLSSG